MVTYPRSGVVQWQEQQLSDQVKLWYSGNIKYTYKSYGTFWNKEIMYINIVF